MKAKKIRVIHYGLGPIGLATAKLVLTKPDMEIVGAVDIAKEMVGKDLGEILGVQPLGVHVTDNAERLFAKVQADVVVHTAGSRLKRIVGQVEEILRGGKNLVSSAEELLFATPENAEMSARIDKLAREKGVTVLGTGVNPGFVMDALPLTLTGVCQEVREVHVERVVDAGTRRHPLQRKIGAGMTPELFREKVAEKAMGHVGLRESLYLIADRLHFVLDDIRESVEPVIAEKPLKTDYFELKPGDVAGIRNIGEGLREGKRFSPSTFGCISVRKILTIPSGSSGRPTSACGSRGGGRRPGDGRDPREFHPGGDRSGPGTGHGQGPPGTLLHSIAEGWIYGREEGTKEIGNDEYQTGDASGLQHPSEGTGGKAGRRTEAGKEDRREKDQEAVQIAESLTAEGVGKEIAALKLEIGKTLTRISDQLEGEVNRFVAIRSAITAKEKELPELYEIEKTAMSLAALIEAQNQKRQEFTAEMEKKKELLRQEIDTTRTAWEKEQEDHDAAVKERDTAEKKRQTREKEEFDYAFKREQQLAADRFTYEKAKLEKELKDKKEQLEKELNSREAAIAEKEAELNDLRKQAAQFPKELETSVTQAVKETSDRLLLEAKTREELLKKESEGERNVFKARIDSLEKTAEEQGERITVLTKQLEAAYQKVQDIAVKTVEGASNFKSVASLQQLLGEQMRKQTTEK